MGVTENCLISSKNELIGLSWVCHGNPTSKKSMIPMTLKHQNWAELLIENKLWGQSVVISLFLRFAASLMFTLLSFLRRNHRKILSLYFLNVFFNPLSNPS